MKSIWDQKKPFAKNKKELVGKWLNLLGAIWEKLGVGPGVWASTGYLYGVYLYNGSIYLSLHSGVGFSILMQGFPVFTCFFLAPPCVLDAHRKHLKGVGQWTCSRKVSKATQGIVAHSAHLARDMPQKTVFLLIDGGSHCFSWCVDPYGFPK